MLNALTYAAAAATTEASAAARQVRERQDGAETVQVVMIMGIFAIIVAILFLTPAFGLRDRITELGDSIGTKLGLIGEDVNTPPPGGMDGS